VGGSIGRWIIGIETMNESYLATARLMAQIAPMIFFDDRFALKGGTAINLFFRDMPRLSVDLDLVFPDYTLARDAALARISDGIQQAAERLRSKGYQVRTSTTADAGDTKLFVRLDSVEVKVETNFVMRGTIQPVHQRSLSLRASEILMADMEIPVVAMEDVYGSKLVAALDRQHPRDLFDVMKLLANEGITPGIRRAFVVYLASHNRPLHEVLFPNLRDITFEYENNFNGMTSETVGLPELLDARDMMISELHQGLISEERDFLISMAEGSPDWKLLDIAHAEQLPGIRWKLRNLALLKENNPEKFEGQAETLVTRLKGIGG
jgi:predicted nucleotidyltransferase component of viral defense system